MTTTPGLLSPEYRKISTAIYLGIALVAFEGTAVAAALPQLAADLGRIDLLSWVITAFLFASGLVTIIAGPLVDAIGSRKVFVAAAAIFAVSGFAAGLVTNIFVLIALRLVQGGGSGALIAASIAAVNLAYPSNLTPRAFAANSTIWGIMGAAAPAIAAVVLNIASWRWIFFINLPLGMLCILTARSTFPEQQDGAETPSIDWIGAGLAAVVTLATIVAVDELGYRSLIMLSVVGIAGYLFILHARRTERPVLRLQHIAGHPYRSLGLTPTLMVTSAFATNIYITLYVSAGRGWSAGESAWAVLFLVIGWTTGANTSSLLQARFHEVDIMTLGLASGLIGSGTTAIFAWADSSVIGVFAGLFASGVGIGLATNAALILLRAATEPRLIGRAGAAHQFMRNQGFTIGSAAGAAILLLVVGRELGSVEPVQQLLAGEEVVAGPLIASSVRDGFTAVAVVAFVIMLLAVVPMRALRTLATTKSA
ncbi:MAG: MFS transporter [Acidimicrobiales bacterium]|nr:MFS transporter [Acidimicrobiales bacterium]